MRESRSAAPPGRVRPQRPPGHREGLGVVALIDCIDRTRKARDTVGGVFEVQALGVPVGLGSYVQWDRKLDGLLAQALMSIQAIKGVEIGPGFEVARVPGTQAHDAIVP